MRLDMAGLEASVCLQTGRVLPAPGFVRKKYDLGPNEQARGHKRAPLAPPSAYSPRSTAARWRAWAVEGRHAS
ncbi:hypothetical protein MTO96_035644 [Rhipicephalus appendiculatus]